MANGPNATDYKFADILTPITPAEFFSDYYDKKPLHISGKGGKFKNIMNWDILTKILNMNAIWSEKSLVMVQDRNILPPLTYCSPNLVQAGVGDMANKTGLIPDAVKVMDLLKQGASLGLNEIDTLTPEIANLVNIFEKTLTAKGQCNLYCSSAQRQAFRCHFDTHDVYAIHFEGQKTWRIWENRMNHPIQHPRYISPGEKFDMENRGPVMMEVDMKPGDLLYLPRGYYHDALSSSQGCVHIAFGMTHIIGMDLLSNISDMAVDHDIYRQNFPPATKGRQALKDHAKALVKTLGKIVESDEFLDAFERYQNNFYYQRGGFSLPVKPVEIIYQIQDKNLKIQQHQGQWVLSKGSSGGVSGGSSGEVSSPRGVIPIPAGYKDLLAWVLNHKKFKRNEFTKKFSAIGIDELDKFLTDIQNMNLIKRL